MTTEFPCKEAGPGQRPGQRLSLVLHLLFLQACPACLHILTCPSMHLGGSPRPWRSPWNSPQALPISPCTFYVPFHQEPGGCPADGPQGVLLAEQGIERHSKGIQVLRSIWGHEFWAVVSTSVSFSILPNELSFPHRCCSAPGSSLGLCLQSLLLMGLRGLNSQFNSGNL